MWLTYSDELLDAVPTLLNVSLVKINATVIDERVVKRVTLKSSTVFFIFPVSIELDNKPHLNTVKICIFA